MLLASLPGSTSRVWATRGQLEWRPGGRHRGTTVGTLHALGPQGVDRLLQLELDVMATGRTYPTPRFDPRKQVHETRQQFGVYFSPWFKPFHTEFRY